MVKMIKYNTYLHPVEDKDLIRFLEKSGNSSATFRMGLRLLYNKVGKEIKEEEENG